MRFSGNAEKYIDAAIDASAKGDEGKAIKALVKAFKVGDAADRKEIKNSIRRVLDVRI